MKKCPSCEIVMNEVTKSGILIDVCPKCMGIWLDKGELEKIIAHSESFEYQDNYQRKNSGHHDDDYDDYHDKHHDHYSGKVYYDKHGKPIRKGGFRDILGNLFD